MYSFFRKMKLIHWILVSMVLGTLIGWLFPEEAQHLKPFSTLFLRMIQSLIAPLIFSTLVVGIAGHGDDMKRVFRLALRSIIYFEIVTTLALFIGLGAVNLVRPGEGVVLPPPTPAELEKIEQAKKADVSNKGVITHIVEHMVPTSIFAAAAANDVLAIVCWAIIFAVGLARVPDSKPKQAMLGFLEGLAQVMFKFTDLVMLCAPVGIGAALAVTVGHSGLGILLNLGLLVLTLYGALVVLLLVVLLPVALAARVPLGKFGLAIKEPALLAFTTTSSEAALPKAMEAMEDIGVPRRIVAFVMPTGYSFNLDGTTLYLAIATVFAFQAGGVPLSWGEQFAIMLSLMLTSKGVAAVPRASLVILTGTLIAFGKPQLLPVVAVILGVDELMDMARTTVNLVGNCLAACVMARWEGEFDDNATGLESPEPLPPGTKLDSSDQSSSDIKQQQT